MKFRRTKVICTIGPKSDSKNQILKLARAGMNIARLNMSHGEHKWYESVIKNINTVNKRYGFNIAIMLDTKGPEIRTGDLPDPVKVKKGQMLTLTVCGAVNLAPNTIWINYDHFVKDVRVGDKILIDNGLLKLRVIKKTSTEVGCECLNNYVITSRRHVNLPKISLKLPAITKKDWKDISFAIKNEVNFIALSFVRRAKDIEQVKAYLIKKKVNISVIAKIESHESIPKIEQIIKASDGVLIARGDLGAELPYYEVPVLQREIINICNEMNKPVIVATHILESMIQHSAPTRAEVSDLSQAVFQRADATMLSGETAIGGYPVESVKTMVNVINRIEEEIYKEDMVILHDTSSEKEEMAEAASVMATNLKIKAILVFTHTGRLALLVSRCRPNSSIFAFSRTEGIDKKLQLAFGVYPFHYTAPDNSEKKIMKAFQILRKKHFLKKGDKVIVISDIRITGDKCVQSIQVREI